MYIIITPHIFHFFEASMGHTLPDLASLFVMIRGLDGPKQLDVSICSGNDLTFDGAYELERFEEI